MDLKEETEMWRLTDGSIFLIRELQSVSVKKIQKLWSY